MNKNLNQLVSNFLYLSINVITTSVLSFIFWLFLAKLLSPSDYGVVSSTINFSLLLSSFSILGFNFSIVKFVSEYLTRGLTKEISAILNFSFKLMTAIGILLGAIIILSSGLLSGILKIPANGLIISGFIIIFLTLATFFDTFLRSFQNMRAIAFIQFIGQISKVAIGVALIFLGFGYMGALVGLLALYVFMTLLGMKFVKIGVSNTQFRNKGILLKYSLAAFFTTLLAYVFFSGRYLILNILHNPTVTGIFALSITLTTPLFFLPNILLQALFPITSQLHDKSNFLNKLIRSFIRYNLLFSLPLTMFIIIFSKQLIILFSTESYLAAIDLLPIVSVASIVLSLANIFHQTLYTQGETTGYRDVLLLSIIAFLIVSIPVTFKYAEVGMALSFLFFSLVLAILAYYKLQRITRILIPYLSIFKILLATVVSMSILFLLVKLYNGLFWGITSFLISMVSYLVLLIFLKFFEIGDINTMKNLLARAPFLKHKLKGLINLLQKLPLSA